MPILAFDVETTGFSPNKDRIIEFGGVAFDDNGKVIGKVSQIINPQCQIPPKVTEITGITQAMAEGGIPFEDFAPHAYKWLSRAPVWCGQNVSFDKGFIKSELKRSGFDFPEKPTLDTLAIARRFIPNDVLKSKKLSSLSYHFGVQLTNAHRAIDDAEATGAILFKMIEQLDLTLEQLIQEDAVELGKKMIGQDPFEAQFLGQA